MKTIQHLLALALPLATGFAWAVCPAPDDVGDDTGTAEVMSSTSYDKSFNIAASDRADVDFFSFVAIPCADYTFTVSDTSIAALDVCLRASDGIHILDRKNTAGGAATINFTWSDDTIGGLFYLDVRSLGEATIGSYRMRMNVTLPSDIDNDQLPDKWEAGPWANGALSSNGFTGRNAPHGTHHDFDNDGFTNFQELLMGTDPTLAGSGLVILDIFKDEAKADVTWPAVRFGTYEVSWMDVREAGNWPNEANWNMVDHFTHMGATGDLVTEDDDGLPPTYKIYRVRQYGIPEAP